MNATTATVFEPFEYSRLELRYGQGQTGFLYDDNRLDRPRQAWEWMRQTLQCPDMGDWVRHEVAVSWQRCLDEHHLRFTPSFPRSNAKPPFLNQPNPELLRLSEIVEQQLGLLIGEAGLTLSLMDAECRLICLIGRDFGDCPMGRLLIYPLADWSERFIGNNGMGSAAVTLAPAAFCGEEHFLHLLHPFSSAGFPLLGQDGQLLAVIGLLSDQRIQPCVLKSLVCMLGKRVQATLQEDTQRLPYDCTPGYFRAWPLSRSRSEAGVSATNLGPSVPIAAADVSNATLECRLAEKATRLQERRIPILVVGESGAGKEHLVRMAYQAGPRRDGPFIALNCASLPRDLIESELFGYAAGSFTGARKEGKPGKFLLADKGVLFLDEIGDMGLDLQAVLLRVLENSEFFPVGASQPVKVDVQIFAATNVPIQQAVREGRFRRDLYYRLNGAQIILPPLREREDKLLIIQKLLDKELALAGKTGPGRLERAVLDLFMRHPWHGNIRQLSNVIRSSLQMSEGDAITLADLPDDFFEELNQAQESTQDTSQTPLIEIQAMEELVTPIMTLEEWELRGIKAALQSCKGNLTQTAKALGITRGTLYKKISQYGIGARQEK